MRDNPMSARTLLELDSSLRRDDVLFAYRGLLSDGLLTALGAALRDRLQHDGIDSRSIRNAFAVFVEQGQNILRFSAERVPSDVAPLGCGTLMIVVSPPRSAGAAGCRGRFRRAPIRPSLSRPSRTQSMMGSLRGAEAGNRDDIRLLSSYRLAASSAATISAHSSARGACETGRPACRYQ